MQRKVTYAACTLLAFILSLPPLAAVVITPVGRMFGCSGGFFNTLVECHTANELVVSLYNALSLAALTGMLFGVVFVPLAIGLSAISAEKLSHTPGSRVLAGAAWSVLLLQVFAIWFFCVVVLIPLLSYVSHA